MLLAYETLNIPGYESKTTFWNDFTIADAYGPKAVKETFDRAFNEWKHDVVYLTELVLVLNHKIWRWYEKDDGLAELYNHLWMKADAYACENLKGEDASYYFRVTD